MKNYDKRERALWLADKLVGDYGAEARCHYKLASEIENILCGGKKT